MIKTEKCVVRRLTSTVKKKKTPSPFLLILGIAVAIAVITLYQSQSITGFVWTQQGCYTGKVASWLIVSGSMLPGKLCAGREYLPGPRA